MSKPQDSDIFGTKNLRIAPRIVNNSNIDPNAIFQSRLDAQYERYASDHNPRNRSTITESQINFTRVNEQAEFDDNYHKVRKDEDMQSSIFYQPTIANSRISERSRITHREVPKHAYDVRQLPKQTTFGRKEVFKREVDNRPQNRTEFKGNCSNVFGYNQMSERNMIKNKIEKLIPHQMQWDQHDSIKCQDGKRQNQSHLNFVQESVSTVFENKKQEKHQVVKKELSKENNEKKSNESKEIAEKKKETQKKQSAIDPEKHVQIMVLKGWNPNLMENLSKYCRINNTKIIGFNFEGSGKGTLTLDKSKRWQTITDWLRKDAKLKIRVK